MSKSETVSERMVRKWRDPAYRQKTTKAIRTYWDQEMKRRLLKTEERSISIIKESGNSLELHSER